MAARRSSGKKSGIKIKPGNRGKLRATAGLGKKKGRKLTVAELNKMKKSPNAKTRKRATFALNARKWRRK
jgi:oligoendopeptidase F